MSLEEMFGIDLNDPTHRLAMDLVEADEDHLNALAETREVNGVSLEDVAKMMGVSTEAVGKIESSERDPRLSTLRRYTLAIFMCIAEKA